jgi:hypothetical protein
MGIVQGTLVGNREAYGAGGGGTVGAALNIATPDVPAGVAGQVTTLAASLPGTKTFLKASGSSNVTITSGGAVVLTAPLAANTSNTFIARVQNTAGDAIEKSFTINGTNILGILSIPSTGYMNTPVPVSGAVPTSTLSLVGNPAGVTIDNVTRSLTFTVSGTKSVDIQEIMAGATGSPKTTTVTISISTAAPISAPFYDTFNGTGSMVGRTGWTRQQTNQFVGWDVLSVSGGNLIGTNTAVNLGQHFLHPTGTTGPSRAWMKTGNTGNIGAMGFTSHTSIDPVNGMTAITLGYQSGINRAVYVNGANNAATSWNVQITPLGSVLEHRTINDNGTIRHQWYFNGRRYTVANEPTNGLDIVGLLGRSNGMYGFNSQLGAGAVRVFSAANSSTDAWLSVVSTNPIRTYNKSLFLYGDYSVPTGAADPIASQLVVNFYDNTTDAVLASNVPIQGFTAANGTWRGTIPAATITFDNYWFEVVWSFQDLNGQAVATVYDSCNGFQGDNIAFDGQSQLQSFMNVFFQGGSGGWPGLAAAPAYVSYQIDGRAGGAKGLVQGDWPDSMNAYITNLWQAYSPRPLTLTYLVAGGSSYEYRASEPQASMFAEALKASGGRPQIIVMGGGTNPDTNMAATLIQMANQYDAATGVTNVYGVIPEGNNLTAGEYGTEDRRRAMWSVTQTDSRFKLLGWRNEFQHSIDNVGSVDPLHYGGYGSAGWISGTWLGNDEFARRIMLGCGLVLGKTTDDYRGPKMTNVTRVNSTTIDITYDIGTFDSIAVANTAYASNFNGGHRFNSASTFAGTAYPALSATVQSTTAGTSGSPGTRGTAVIRFTFASLPPTLYVSGPYGSDPFNPSGLLAITQNMYDRASTIRCSKAGTNRTVALQPSYGVGGANIDFLSA